MIRYNAFAVNTIALIDQPCKSFDVSAIILCLVVQEALDSKSEFNSALLKVEDKARVEGAYLNE